MADAYEIVVRRDGRFWSIEIPQLDGATQARNLSEVDEMAIDYIAIVEDVAPESIAITKRIEVPDSVRSHLDAVAHARAIEAENRTRAAEESRAAARELKQLGLTVREVGETLGVSHQRAQQLISA